MKINNGKIMNQQKIIDDIKKKKGFHTDSELAEFLGISEKGALARMKIGRAGRLVHALCEVIWKLLDDMPKGKGSI